MKKIILVCLLALTIAFFVNNAYAMCGTCGMEAAEHEHGKAATNVGNKICPVSGEEIGKGGMESATYEYKEKTYNFCCPGCIDEFKKDPEKYTKKVEEELKAQEKEK